MPPLFRDAQGRTAGLAAAFRKHAADRRRQSHGVQLARDARHGKDLLHQAAENGTFGPDGKGNSVFEIVGSALTETPLGAILLAVIVAGILAFAMVRRYRRIKREQ